MSRPKPLVLLSYTDPKTYKTEQILKAKTVYAVFYDGAPINIRSLNTLINFSMAKYKKSSFQNPGHAFNLAEKLNKLFKTDKFAVYKLGGGTKVFEENIK